MPGTTIPQSGAPPLGPADLHVWTAQIAGPAGTEARFGDIFSAEERARAARFVQPRDGDAFLQAHGALRMVLARYLGADPAVIAFATGRWGKPALAGALAASGITFNMSHSGGIALIAVARERAVGIDVEAVRAMPEALGIARRMLGAEAVAALEALDPTARDEAFLRLWTGQEACIKALGLALAVAANTLRIGVAGGAPTCAWVDPEAAPQGLALVPLATAPGHVAALAWARREASDSASQIVRFDYASASW